MKKNWDNKQAIKGKIAEIVFGQMFGDTKKFTVIPFGYETLMPVIVQSVKKSGDWNLLDTVRNAPDFALVSHEPEQVILVEVKYRSSFDPKEVQDTATGIYNRWKSAWLFYASPSGFYFDKCTDLMKKGAKLSPLKESVIPLSLQEEYLGLLTQFIKR